MLGKVRLVGGDTSTQRLSESNDCVTSALTSMFEKTHIAVYLHKNMLNDSTHIECVVQSMKFCTGP